MIESLHIQNFQSHEDTLLEFSPGVNVIIGQSDSGKSSIIRALRLVLENKPTGDAYVSWWSDNTTITLKTVEGYEIIRKRTKSTNSYEVNGEVYKAFGNKIPDEVLGVLNMSEDNCQYQGDPFYLISKTPGEVATHLNQVANFDKIDSSRKSAEQEINKTKTQIEHYKQNLKDHNTNLAKFPDLTKMDIDISSIEKLQQNKIISINLLRKMKKYSEELIEIKNKIQNQNPLLYLKEQIEEIEKLNVNLEKQRKQLTKLENRNNELILLEHELSEAKQIIPLKTKVEEIEKLNMNLAIEKIKLKKLEIRHSEVMNLKTQQNIQEDKLNALKKRYEAVKPEYCPICNSKLV